METLGSFDRASKSTSNMRVVLAALMPALVAGFMAPAGLHNVQLRPSFTSAAVPSVGLRAPSGAVGLKTKGRIGSLRAGRSAVRAPVCMAAKTLFDKIWDDHVVDMSPDGTALIYIDRHLVHEVTSPQAFEGLRVAGRKVRQPGLTLATVDHNVPTTDRSMFESVETFIKELDSRTQVHEICFFLP